MVAKRRRVSSKSPSFELDAVLDAFLVSAATLKARPLVEARKQKQSRVLAEGALYRNLIALSANLSFNRSQLQKALRRVVVKKDSSDSLGNLDIWSKSKAELLKSNCIFIRHAIAKQPRPQWITKLLDPTPVASFFAGQRREDEEAEQAVAGAGAETPSREASPPPIDAEEVPSSQPPSPKRSPTPEQEKADDDEWLYGWSHEQARAWRCKVGSSEKVFCDLLAYRKPYVDKNMEENLWGCWTHKGVDQFREILDMPMTVFCSRYDNKWIVHRKGQEPPAEESPQQFHGEPAPLHNVRVPAASIDAVVAQPVVPAQPDVPVQPAQRQLKPTAKSKLKKTDSFAERARTKAGDLLVLCFKKQNGRNDIWQLRFNDKQLVQAAATDQGQQILRTIMAQIAEGKVSRSQREQSYGFQILIHFFKP